MKTDGRPTLDSACRGRRQRGFARTAAVFFMALAALELEASAIGVSPGFISFNNTVRGGYVEKVLGLSTAGADNLMVKVETSGQIKDWINFEPNQTEFDLPGRSMKPLTVKIFIPYNVQNGQYEGSVIITTLYRGDEPPGNISYARFMPGLIVKIQVGVIGDEISNYKLKSVSARNTEQYYPVEFTATVENTGNVVVTPRLQFTILDDERNPVGKYFDYAETTVLPTVTKEISIKMPTDDMNLGDYYAVVTSGRGETYTVFFQILAPGTLAVMGSLEQISLNKIWVKPGETVRVEGLFRNEGEREIKSAKLKCEANLQNPEEETRELVGVFDGTSVEVPRGQITLEAYFTPAKSGRYSIDCAALYSGRKTPVKSTVLNVMAPESVYHRLITLISGQKAVAFLLITIVLLIAYFYKRRSM